MTNTIKIDFSNYSEDWTRLIYNLVKKLRIDAKDLEIGNDDNIVEFTGEFETIEIFRQLIEMTDGGSII